MYMTQKYHDALDRLEANVLSPVISGELISWIDAIADSADFVGALLWRETEGIHQSDFSQMIQQDPELAPRVERLKAADRECIQHFEALFDRITNLAKLSRHCEPDEGALTTLIGTLTQDLLAWVLEAKRQEKACETWLMEADYRDRGVAD